jgi:glycosyltransferase involved in cell wall biosynthesis
MVQQQPLISLFALTIDRFELSKKTIQTNIDNAEGYAPMELLVADNGSKDKRIIDWVAHHPLTSYHRVNSRNEGVGHAFNQLYLRSKGEYLCFMGSDLELPKGWLREMLGYVRGVPNAGLVGMDWGHGGIPPLTFQHGSHAHWLTPHLNRIFGSWIMKRSVVEKIGLFAEEFGPYGLEDSDFNERVNRAGFLSLYVPNHNFKCKHLGIGDQDSGPYREMKNQSMAKNLGIFHHRMANYHLKGLIEPLPEMRDPL